MVSILYKEKIGRRRPHFGFLAIVLLLSIFSKGTYADTNSDTVLQQATSVVEMFLELEFAGDSEPLREQYIRYSAEVRKNRERTRSPLPIYSFLPNEDPYYVISGYKIVSVVLDQTATPIKGKAVVDYDVVASAVVKAGRISLSKMVNPSSRVTLSLVFEQDRWWILDPPPAHVSASALIGFYEKYLHALDAESDSRWQEERTILQLLRKLK